MHNLDLILTLAAGLIGALGFGYITQRLGWSPIVGYLLAGVLVGPHTPGFVANQGLADQLAEVGVILLMFGVGLHFHLKDLLAVKWVATLGALVQSTIATLLGALMCHAFGWSWSAGIVFGLALSVASTVVLTRVLADAGELQSPLGRIAIGWLVVEDLLTVVILVLLPVAFSGSGASIPAALGIAIAKLGVFVAFMLIGGKRIIPWLLNKIADTRSRELFTLSVLAVAMGIAVASAEFFGVSMALGAFLAGVVVGQSEFSARAGAEALPLRDAFAVMFFLSVGLLLDPRQIVNEPAIILATVAIVLIGKPAAAFGIVALFGYGSRMAVGVALALAQIGEFSFLVAALAKDIEVLPAAAINPLVAAAIVSIMLNPVLFKTVGSMEAFLHRHPGLWKLLNRRSSDVQPTTTHDAQPDTGAYRAIVVGYGPVGRAVTRLLRERGIAPTIVEMNINTYRALMARGEQAVYGDANQREVLEQAGLRGAASLILSNSGAAASTEAIRIAREINPKVHIVSRADYMAQVEPLWKAGANEVFSGEGEVALAITNSLLRALGATPQQLDEERAKIRAGLSLQPETHSPSTPSGGTSPV